MRTRTIIHSLAAAFILLLTLPACDRLYRDELQSLQNQIDELKKGKE